MLPKRSDSKKKMNKSSCDTKRKDRKHLQLMLSGKEELK